MRQLTLPTARQTAAEEQPRQPITRALLQRARRTAAAVAIILGRQLQLSSRHRRTRTAVQQLQFLGRKRALVRRQASRRRSRGKKTHP